MAAPLFRSSLPPRRRQKPSPQAAVVEGEAPGGPNYIALKHMMRDLKLHTVCEEAHCPNIGECWEHKAATFMILGDVCTRNCAYCAVAHGDAGRAPDADEPQRLADAVAQMGSSMSSLRAWIATTCPTEARRSSPHVSRRFAGACRRRRVEVLIPDFKGNPAALRLIVDARPDILNHNLETIARLYRIARPGGRYTRAVELLDRAKDMNPELLTKSGIICGLGETGTSCSRDARPACGTRRYPHDRTVSAAVRSTLAHRSLVHAGMNSPS